MKKESPNILERRIHELENELLKVRQSETRLKSIVSQSAVGIAETDKSGRFILVNDHFCHMVGRSREQLLQLRMQDITHPDDLDRNVEQFKDLVAHDVNFEIEKRYIKPDGSIIWVHNSVSAINSEFVVAVSTDITDKKTAQFDFERSVDVSPAILWITEKDGSCTYLSRRWYEFTGQTKEQALGFGWLDATHPDDKQRAAEAYFQANAEQKPYHAEYRLKTKQGDYRWVIDAANPRYDDHGNYLGYAGKVFDTHEQKLAVDAIKSLQHRFERSAKAIELGVWYCDLPFDELIWNDEVKRHFFLRPEARVNIGLFYERIHPEDREATRAAIHTSIDSRTPYDTIYRTTNPLDASDIKSIRAIGWTDYDATGKPIRFDGITLDVTLDLSRNLELETAKNEADRANQLKSAFLANMSHEIRTPLGAMLGFADLLRDPDITAAERANFVETLSRNGESLSVIIDDILDLSKVEAGHLTLDYADTDPDQIGADVVSLLRMKAAEKNLALDYSFSKTTPESIVTDPVRLRQILVNLISNAIKFTQFGSVKVTSYGGKAQSGRTTLNFEIADTGIGIPRLQQERIFEMFVQADGTMTRRFGGTGLGLALSRSLARQMGGDVTLLKSQEGVGSAFLISIESQPESLKTHTEIKKIEIQNRSEPIADALAGKKILVVDDSPDNQRLIWHFLTRYGALVESAENGMLGYRAALSGNFDLVLMDIQMPVMDGYTATQKLRDNGYRKPIVALTAHAMSEIRKKCLQVGYNEHLTKPINPKDLIKTIIRLTDTNA